MVKECLVVLTLVVVLRCLQQPSWQQTPNENKKNTVQVLYCFDRDVWPGCRQDKKIIEAKIFCQFAWRHLQHWINQINKAKKVLYANKPLELQCAVQTIIHVWLILTSMQCHVFWARSQCSPLWCTQFSALNLTYRGPHERAPKIVEPLQSTSVFRSKLWAYTVIFCDYTGIWVASPKENPAIAAMS
jgi:hypothetical protein